MKNERRHLDERLPKGFFDRVYNDIGQAWSLGTDSSAVIVSAIASELCYYIADVIENEYRRNNLTEEEKRRAKYLYGAGWSYQEITQDTLEGRNEQLFQAILKEVEKCCVHEATKEQ